MQTKYLAPLLKPVMFLNTCLFVTLASGCSRGLVSTHDAVAIRERVFAELIADKHLPRNLPIISDGSGLSEPTALQSLNHYALRFHKEDTAELRDAIMARLRARGMQASDLNDVPEDSLAAVHVLNAVITGYANSMLVVDASISALGLSSILRGMRDHGGCSAWNFAGKRSPLQVRSPPMLPSTPAVTGCGAMGGVLLKARIASLFVP